MVNAMEKYESGERAKVVKVGGYFGQRNFNNKYILICSSPQNLFMPQARHCVIAFRVPSVQWCVRNKGSA